MSPNAIRNEVAYSPFKCQYMVPEMLLVLIKVTIWVRVKPFRKVLCNWTDIILTSLVVFPRVSYSGPYVTAESCSDIGPQSRTWASNNSGSVNYWSIWWRLQWYNRVEVGDMAHQRGEYNTYYIACHIASTSLL